MSNLQLIDSLEKAPYEKAESALGQLQLFIFGALVPIENLIEKTLLDRVANLTPEELVRFQFVKWKRTYRNNYYSSNAENFKHLVDDLTQQSTEKSKAIGVIIYNINKEIYGQLLSEKDGDTYLDLTHYTGNMYVNVNDTKFDNKDTTQYFVRNKTSNLTLQQLLNEKEYEDAKKRNVVILKRLYRTKLHSFISDVIVSYEIQDKDVFDNFDKLKEFVERKINKLKLSFLKMKTGPFNHQLAKLNKKKIIDTDYKQKIYQSANFKLYIPDTFGGKFLITTQRLLNVLLSINTQSGGLPEFTLTIEDYMNLCKIKDRKETIKHLKKDLNILFESYYWWKEIKDEGKIRIIESCGIRNGTVHVTFGSAFWNIFKTYSIGLISSRALAINVHKNPNSQNFSFKITQHKHMNSGKPNENIISVKTLLEGSEIPSYEDIMTKNRCITERIIEPFERDLNALNEDFTWEYCHINGNPLAHDELETFSYKTFIKLNILTHWGNFPDQTKRLEKRRLKQRSYKKEGGYRRA